MIITTILNMTFYIIISQDPIRIQSQEGPRLKIPPKLLGLLRLAHLTMDIYYLALSNIKSIQISYD